MNTKATSESNNKLKYLKKSLHNKNLLNILN
jgi:hypothetical protein